MQLLAQAHGVCPRTLRRWELDSGEAEKPLPGRPAHPAQVRELVRVLVQAVLDEQGWSAGERPVHHEVGDTISLSLTREALAKVKAERRRRIRSMREQARRSIRVLARDALWSQDATHVGRDEEQGAVQAEVLREVASTRTLEVMVGPPATAQDVISILDRAHREHRRLPLVWATDNAAAYCSAEVRAWLADHLVVPLLSLPRTPQHNACSEHGMRELKDEAELDGADDILEMLARLLAARERLDEHRPRRSRGWQTAVQADAALPPAETLVSREAFYAAAHCAMEKAVLHSRTNRERRRATRTAVLQCMQHFGLITMTRAGATPTRATSDTIS